MRRMITSILVAYTLLLVGCVVLQRRLIYHPAQLSIDEAVACAERTPLTPWRNSSGAIIGWRTRHASPGAQPLLVMHGNAGCALHRAYFVDALAAAGLAERFALHILEYPGYGARPGAPTEHALVAAAAEAVEILSQTHPQPVILIGESLGTGVAASVARAHPAQVAGLMLITPFDSLAAVGQSQMFFLPVHLILLDRYDSASNLASYTGPVAIIVAARDEVIHPRFGVRLHNRLTTNRKRLWTLEGAGHNTIPFEAPWFRECLEFLTARE